MAITERFRYLRLAPLPEKFWARVNIIFSADACWEWQDNRSLQGYGRFSHDGKREVASRIAYRLVYGPFDEELQVCHRCDNPPCVRPNHLFLGDHELNQKDKVSKGRAPWGENHGQAKLSEVQVREIRSLDLPDKDIATMYGICLDYINAIRNRRAWKRLL